MYCPTSCTPPLPPPLKGSRWGDLAGEDDESNTGRDGQHHHQQQQQNGRHGSTLGRRPSWAAAAAEADGAAAAAAAAGSEEEEEEDAEAAARRAAARQRAVVQQMREQLTNILLEVTDKMFGECARVCGGEGGRGGLVRWRLLGICQAVGWAVCQSISKPASRLVGWSSVK